MRIVTVAYLHGAGGAERQIIMLSNEMAIRGHDVHMIVLNEFNSHYPISENVKIYNLTEQEKGKLGIIKRFIAFKKQ